MSESKETRVERLRQALRMRATQIPRGAARLGEAVWNADDAVVHEDYLARLPEYIDAEVVGVNVAQLYPDVKRHLDQCDRCAEEYAALLDTALAEARGQLPRPTVLPQPDLAFLRQTAPMFTDVILQWARALITQLHPAGARELSVIAETFFEQAQALGGEFYLKPGPAPALNFGRGEPSDTLKTLAATYATTRILTQTLSRRELEEWQARGALVREIETRALTAAQTIGLDNEFSALFAREYAAHIAREPRVLLTLLSSP
ncbi:MAG TPA: hypothetical protein VFD70_15745 [Anaerolineae bacterium]|nr:hypothetical protein [Anaerolineae bacterium]